MKPTTLCFPVDEKGHFLLGLKKRGFGKDKYNGFGGKITDGESFRTCTLRELYEEVSLLGRPEDLEPIAYIDFRFPYEPELTHFGYVYMLKTYGGTPLESEEMIPRWFAPQGLPYEQMWEGDRTWLPKLLEGKKLVGYVTFGEDKNTVIHMKLEEVDSISEKEHEDPTLFVNLHRDEIPWTSTLLAWFDANRRDLPWRKNKDPYRIWVSEIMLQQTRVEAVKPYFEAWMHQFPTLYDVAKASEDTVLKAWQGLGYYSRARNLQAGLREVATTYKGHIPKERNMLESLKGIGSYTAGAILSIAYNLPEVAIDGNVLRIYARLYNRHEDILSTLGKKSITKLVKNTLPFHRPGDFNEALMDFGSAICIPKAPRCTICPLQRNCLAYKEGTAQNLPVRKKKKAPLSVPLTILPLRKILGEKRGKYEFAYLVHCRQEGVLIRMWEFPPLEQLRLVSARGETLGTDSLELILGHSFLQQLEDLLEEIPLSQSISHTFSHLRWLMKVYEPKTLTPKEVVQVEALRRTDESQWKWVSPQEFMELSWAGPHGKIASALQGTR